nr:MAG TPA: hypothetical protein [Inoviridae sp.]
MTLKSLLCFSISHFRKYVNTYILYKYSYVYSCNLPIAIYVYTCYNIYRQRESG